MNSEEAKRVLEVFRASGADMSDPRFTEALLQTERDPELGRWFEDQRRFDHIVVEGLKTIAVPSDLRDKIVAERKVVRLGSWARWRTRAALAASFAILAAGGVFATNKPVYFPEFRAELVEQAWDGRSHLDFESSDPGQIQKWLTANNASAAFSVPEGLRDLHLIGCRIVRTDGLRVPMLCLTDGTRHMHLFVMDDLRLAQMPVNDQPDFEKCGVWRTASWQLGNTTYVLTGMKYQAFVNKFRKGGRWTMSGEGA